MAAAFLDSLAGQGMVIVSSHSGVLGPLLAHNYDALLGSSGEVQANAEKVFSWLSQYLAHPTRDVQVLCPTGAGQAS